MTTFSIANGRSKSTNKVSPIAPRTVMSDYGDCNTAPIEGLRVNCVLVREKATGKFTLYHVHGAGKRSPILVAMISNRKRSVVSSECVFDIFDTSKHTPETPREHRYKKDGSFHVATALLCKSSNCLTLVDPFRLKEYGALQFDKRRRSSGSFSESHPKSFRSIVPPIDKMKRTVPNYLANSTQNEYGSLNGTLLYQLNRTYAMKSYIKFATKSITRQDEYELEYGKYSGQFKVVESSKNFQLVAEGTRFDNDGAKKIKENTVLCQFAKISSDTFRLEFTCPLTALQVFAMALAQFA